MHLFPALIHPAGQVPPGLSGVSLLKAGRVPTSLNRTLVINPSLVAAHPPTAIKATELQGTPFFLAIKLLPPILLTASPAGTHSIIAFPSLVLPHLEPDLELSRIYTAQDIDHSFPGRGPLLLGFFLRLVLLGTGGFRELPAVCRRTGQL